MAYQWWDLPLCKIGATSVPNCQGIGCRTNKSVLVRTLQNGSRGVKAKWLEEQFSNPLLADANEVLAQQYARFYILGMLGGMLFMDKSGERLSIMYLQFFNPISNGKNYSQGNVALSWLYRHLCKASEKTAKQIGGTLLLVQLWAWARFPHIFPVIRHPHQALPLGQLAIRYVGSQVVRASSSALSNVPNAKYLAHLTHQTPKTEHHEVCYMC